MTRILVTGRGGQLGEELRRSLHPLGAVLATGRDELDLSDPDSIRRACARHQPDVVVNAGAYTAVDRAESEPELAMAVNGTAPGILAEEARRRGALLVHFSTEYVFDGRATDPYAEDAPTAPLNVYGRSKLAGEEAVRASGADHLIFRTSWVYGLRGRNFLLTMLRLAGERDELRVVDDQIGAPSWSRALAVSTAAVLARLALPGRPEAVAGAALGDPRELSGTYHMTAAGRASWCEFTGAILEEAGLRGRPDAPRLVPIASADYPTAARRPANSLLSNERLKRTFGLAQLHWREGLRLCLAER